MEVLPYIAIALGFIVILMVAVATTCCAIQGRISRPEDDELQKQDGK